MPYNNDEQQRAYHKAYREKNRVRITSANQARYAADPEKYKKYQRGYKAARRAQLIDQECLRRHGIGVAQREALLAQQGGVCEICREVIVFTGRASGAVVDHCHSTGKVRGVLCGQCNVGMGNLQDNPDRLRAAADYIERHRG